MDCTVSPLQKARMAYAPKVPAAFKAGANVACTEGEKLAAFADTEKITAKFPSTSNMPLLTFAPGNGEKIAKPINVAVILSGGQAPGGHNVIAGLFDGLKSLNPESRLYGFKGGPSGLTDNKYIEITADFLAAYRNTGGFDMSGSQLQSARNYSDRHYRRRRFQYQRLPPRRILQGEKCGNHCGRLPEDH